MFLSVVVSRSDACIKREKIFVGTVIVDSFECIFAEKLKTRVASHRYVLKVLVKLYLIWSYDGLIARGLVVCARGRGDEWTMLHDARARLAEEWTRSMFWSTVSWFPSLTPHLSRSRTCDGSIHSALMHRKCYIMWKGFQTNKLIELKYKGFVWQ